MIQRFWIGELVHNIKTDEVGKIQEIHLDTASSTRYRVSLSGESLTRAGGEATWDESDLIASSHKAAS